MAEEETDPDAPPYTDARLNFDCMPQDSDNPGSRVDFVFTPITLERVCIHLSHSRNYWSHPSKHTHMHLKEEII